MIFSLISNRLKEMRTVTELLDSAGRIARENGCTSPGSEHLLLAALDLPDGTARRVLESTGVNCNQLVTAISNLHQTTLQKIGIPDQTIKDGFGNREPLANPVFPQRAEESAINLLRDCHAGSHRSRKMRP